MIGGIWRLICLVLGRVGTHQAQNENMLISMILGNYNLPASFLTVVSNIIKSLFVNIRPTGVPHIVTFALTVLPLQYIYFKTKNQLIKKILVWIYLSYIVSILLLAVSILTLFANETQYTSEPRAIYYILQRYLSYTLAGNAYLLIYFLVDNSCRFRFKKQLSIVLLAVLIAIFPYSVALTAFRQWTYRASTSDKIYKKYHIDLSLIEEGEVANILTGYDNDFMNMRYVYAPHKITRLLETTSGEQLKEKIIEGGFTHIILFGGEARYQGYPSIYYLIEEYRGYPIELDSLYEIVVEDGEVYFELL